MPVQTKRLRTILQNAHKGFAYELLALEIEVQSCKDEKNETMIGNLSKLIQLYMLGVEVLQSNYDVRYKYFNEKIQGLMKKRHVIEELHMASTGDKNVPKAALEQVNKQLRENRKNEYDINIFLNKDQCDIKRIKELVQKQQVKVKAFEYRLKSSLETQQKNINERIKTRKMKSQCYSSRKFDLGSNAPEEKMKQVMLDNDDIFGRKDKTKNGRRSSGQKKKSVLNV